MKESEGQIYGFLPDGKALVAAAIPDSVDTSGVRLLWFDSEMINHEQRKKIFALVGDIAEWSGHDPEYTRKNLTADFLRANIERLQLSAISLAITGNCDKGTASLYIDYLINFCLENSVFHKNMRPLYENCEDIQRYVYACLLHKKCAICGRKADIHHCEGSMVGMGRNRNSIIHVGLELMPLCREHHQECHSIGQKAFNEKYHLEGVIADEKLCKKVGLKYAS